MTEMNQAIGNKFHFGKKEFTNLMWVLIRAYRYHNKNQNPEAIVMPDVHEVVTPEGNIKIEWPEVKIEKPKPGASKASSGDGGEPSKG